MRFILLANLSEHTACPGVWLLYLMSHCSLLGPLDGHGPGHCRTYPFLWCHYLQHQCTRHLKKTPFSTFAHLALSWVHGDAWETVDPSQHACQMTQVITVPMHAIPKLRSSVPGLFTVDRLKSPSFLEGHLCVFCMFSQACTTLGGCVTVIFSRRVSRGTKVLGLHPWQTSSWYRCLHRVCRISSFLI